MIVIASQNGKVGIAAAIAVLRAGGSAVEAVEAGIRPVEANADDHTVGYNGFPNILGEVELDASIMEGRGLRAGGVAALKGYPHAITLARQVMDHLPHVLLAGSGAARFAREMGAEQQGTMIKADVLEIYRRKLEGHLPAGMLDRLSEEIDLRTWVNLATDPERAYSTVNFIAIDRRGDICSGVSTSGWAWKYPGRVGDSPLIGAGNYADNRFGACACTGMGEMAIRANTAHSVIFYMKMGLPVEEAGRWAMEDLRQLGGPYAGIMNLIAIDHKGNHAGFASTPGRQYIAQTPEMDQPQEIERTVIDLPQRWPLPPRP